MILLLRPKRQQLQLFLFALEALDRLGIHRFVQLADIIQSVQHVIAGVEDALVILLPLHAGHKLNTVRLIRLLDQVASFREARLCSS